MARTSTEVIPETKCEVERRTKEAYLRFDEGGDTLIHVVRVKCLDGKESGQPTTVQRKLKEVGDQKFADTGLTIAEAMKAWDETFDRFAEEDNEP